MIVVVSGLVPLGPSIFEGAHFEEARLPPPLRRQGAPSGRPRRVPTSKAERGRPIERAAEEAVTVTE